MKMHQIKGVWLSIYHCLIPLLLTTPLANAADDAIKLLPISNQTVDEGQILIIKTAALRPQASDFTASKITYTFHGLEKAGPRAGFSVWEPEVFKWDTGFDDAGQYPVEICANDLKSKACRKFEIEVKNKNQKPVLQAIQPVYMKAGEEINFTLKAEDADGGRVQYEVVGLPKGAQLIKQTGNFKWRPKSENIGFYQIGFYALDDKREKSDMAEMFLEVYPENAEAPIITKNPDAKAVTGDRWTYVPEAVDPLGRKLSFYYENLPVPWGPFEKYGLQINHETGEISGLVTGSMIGKHRVILIVAAPDGIKTAKTFLLEVLPGQTICDKSGESKFQTACAILQQAYVQGEAGGTLSEWQGQSYGVVYENDDNGHSLLDPNLFPQVSYFKRYIYGIQYQNRQKGQLNQIIIPEDDQPDNNQFETSVHLSNASTALKLKTLFSSRLISHARLLMERPENVKGLFEVVYQQNRLIFAPAVEDFKGPEPVQDLYMGNNLYVLNSQGMSGSDQPFMHAALLFASALDPEIKAEILKGGYFVPVFQMALRKSMQGAEDPSAYFSGIAHPSAFAGDKIDYEQLIQIAFEINQLNNLPPIALFSVLGESFFLEENIYTTPAALARVWKRFELAPKRKNVRTLILDGRNSFDPEGDTLTYGWIVLQGDFSKIRIAPLNKEKSVVRIESEYENQRVDIGLFVKTPDGQGSAPAIISISNEVRGEFRIYKRLPL